jgi:hypothetical protein
MCKPGLPSCDDQDRVKLARLPKREKLKGIVVVV